MSRRSRAAGFSLLEVLVAFVILALVATALFRLFSGSLGNAVAADEWSRALMVAESRLAQTAAAQPLREIGERGSEDDGRIRWETKVAPFTVQGLDLELEQASQALAMRLYRISVEVRFDGANGRERSLSLGTVKMGPKDPA